MYISTLVCAYPLDHDTAVLKSNMKSQKQEKVSKDERLAIYVPADIKKQLHMIADAQYISVSQAGLSAILAYIESKKNG